MSTTATVSSAPLGLRQAAPASVRPATAPRSFKARGLAALLLAGVVAAMVLVADHLVSTWADGHLFLAWVMLWVIVFALAGAAMGMLITQGLTPEQIDSWGWRLPFLASVVLLLVGWWIRAKVAESPDFEQMSKKGKQVPIPALEVLRHYPREVLLVVGGRLAEVTWFYTVVTFALAWRLVPRTGGGQRVQLDLLGAALISLALACVVVRRAYGIAGSAMSNAEAFQYRFAWPSGDWGSLPIEGGVEVAYKSELEAAEDPAAHLEAIRAGR